MYVDRRRPFQGDAGWRLGSSTERAAGQPGVPQLDGAGHEECQILTLPKRLCKKNAENLIRLFPSPLEL